MHEIFLKKILDGIDRSKDSDQSHDAKGNNADGKDDRTKWLRTEASAILIFS